MNSLTYKCREKGAEYDFSVESLRSLSARSNTLSTWGETMIVDPWGKVLDKVVKGKGIAIADLDLSYVDRVRANIPIREHREAAKKRAVKRTQLDE